MRDDSRTERWRRVEELYHAGLALSAGQREGFLAHACGGDAQLRDEVAALLSISHEAEAFLEPWAGLAVGSCLGPYEITALVGSGGMGEVYRAHDARLGRDVAVKVLPAGAVQDRSVVERFVREARAASALNHPNIVTIHEIGETGRAHFIVMELIEGRTLRAMAGEPLPVDTLVSTCAQMARALAVAHRAGIVHRDIKPENVMVRADGYVKLLDFGLARLVGAPPTSERGAELKTTPGIPVGTVQYMSPEQARGSAVTPATDVFSFGAVMYELATGRRPFTDASDVAVLHRIIFEPPDRPSCLNPEIPPAIERLVMRMLEKDPRRRPSAEDVEGALAEIAGGHHRLPSARPAGRRMRNTVGRDGERAGLRAALESALDARGLLLCVAGEPGIGKTTLVEDFLSDVEAEGVPCSVGRGRSSERLAGAEAYLPWLEALESLLQGDSVDPVARAMKQFAPTWYDWIAPAAPADAALARAAADAPALSPERMKRELCAFVQGVARARPLILFFDDVHWADVSTIDLLAYVATKIETSAVLIVAAYRPSELLLADHPFVRIRLDLQARGMCREIALPFLTAADVARYLALEFPGHRFPDDLQRAIHARTEGNPLFTIELVKHLRVRGVIGQEHGRWAAHPTPDFMRDLPESVRSVIQTRIGQLGEADHALLTAASVQGYEFDSATVSTALAVPAVQVEEQLDVLDRVHGLVTIVKEHHLPDRSPTVRYRFVHVLYQNALYASLRPTRKAMLSAAIARALIGTHGRQDVTIASQLAILLEAARDFERAAEYFLLAAQQAAQRSANQEAVVLARRGLDAIALMPDAPRRAPQELRLAIALGSSLMITVGWGSPEVEAAYARARALCHEALEDAQLFPVIWGLWQYSLARAEYAPARELGARMLAVAEKTDDPALLLMAHHSLSNTEWQCGRFDLARTHAERAVAIYRPERHRSLAASYGGHDAGVANRGRLAVNLWLLGYPDQALARARDAIALAREIAHSPSIVLALGFDAMVCQLCGDAARTRASAAEAVALAGDLALSPWLAWASALHGWAIAAEGRWDAGIVDLEQGVAAWTAAGVDGLRPYFLSLLADACARAGRRDRALSTLADARAITERTREGYALAELHRLEGELLPAAAAADACFERAIEIARRQQAKSLELRAVTSAARLRSAHGRRREARAALADVYGWFTEGFHTVDLENARALLQRLSG